MPQPLYGLDRRGLLCAAAAGVATVWDELNTPLLQLVYDDPEIRIQDPPGTEHNENQRR